MKIYHNPRCSKSRQTLAILTEAGVDAEVIEYLKEPPTTAELDDILKKLKLEPQQIARTKESLYADLGLRGKKLSRDEWLTVLVENPKLIERPIVVKGRQAVIGRPPENVHELL